MDRAYIDITLPNVVSVTVMALVGIGLVVLIRNFGAKYITGAP